MTAVYIGVGVLVLVVIAVFAGLNWKNGQDRAAAYATPTPGASPSSSPIPLADGQALGVAVFKDQIPDTPRGGRGQPVDGITCGAMEFGNLHVHSHVALFDNGKQIQIPRLVGAGLNAQGEGCLYWLHTHDASGIVHVEAPVFEAPKGGPFTLGMFFDIWGQPLGNDGIATFKGPVTAYVNGVKYDGDLRAIPLISHQQIVL